MAISDKTTLKTYFQTGDVPTELQFIDLIDTTLPQTAKGDLVTFSTLPAILAAGADTYILTADSTTATGLKWAAPAATGITIGTTAITGGATTQMLFNLGGVVSSNAGLTYVAGGLFKIISTTQQFSAQYDASNRLDLTIGITGNATFALTGTAPKYIFSDTVVAAGNVFEINSTSTAAASSTQTIFSVSSSGVNGTAAQTTYGAKISNIHTGTTSTNIGLEVIARGGATANKQLMLSYDSTTNFTFSVGSTGVTTFGGAGSGGSAILLTQALTFQQNLYSTGGAILCGNTTADMIIATTSGDTGSGGSLTLQNYSSKGGFTLRGSNSTTNSTDSVKPDCTINAANAPSNAVTNIIGGKLKLTGGAGSTASAGLATGGDIWIDGGIGYGTGLHGNVYLASQRGLVGIGFSTIPSAKLHVISTTEQFRAGYDASNYASFTVGSTGNLTVDLTGTTPKFQFNKYIGITIAPTALLTLGAGLTTAGGAPLKFTTQASALATPEQGTMELVGNSLQFTQLVKRRGVVMSHGVIVADVSANNTVTETAALITASHGANSLETGKSEEIHLYGTIEQNVSGGGILSIRTKYAGATIHTTSTITGNIPAGTPFIVKVIMTCRTTGATGTVQINSYLEIGSLAVTPGTVNLVTVDTTTGQDTTVTAIWSVANANNNVTFNQGHILCIEPNR